MKELLERIEQLQACMDFRKGEECFFRGQADASWSLQPTLFRLSHFLSRVEGDLLTMEYDLYYEFKARSKSLNKALLTDWDILFYMRHHTVPTRLLDWTEGLGAALHFATDEPPSQEAPAALWLMNPYRLNQAASGVRDLYDPTMLPFGDDDDDEGETWYEEILLQYDVEFGWDCPIAIYPNQTAERMHAQKGWFTIHGDAHEPLEELLQGKVFMPGSPLPKESPVLCKITLAASMRSKIEEYLTLMGITPFTLFPDLDGLSKDLKKKFQLKT